MVNTMVATLDLCFGPERYGKSQVHGRVNPDVLAEAPSLAVCSPHSEPGEGCVADTSVPGTAPFACLDASVDQAHVHSSRVKQRPLSEEELLQLHRNSLVLGLWWECCEFMLHDSPDTKPSFKIAPDAGCSYTPEANDAPGSLKPGSRRVVTPLASSKVLGLVAAHMNPHTVHPARRLVRSGLDVVHKGAHIDLDRTRRRKEVRAAVMKQDDSVGGTLWTHVQITGGQLRAAEAASKAQEALAGGMLAEDEAFADACAEAAAIRCPQTNGGAKLGGVGLANAQRLWGSLGGGPAPERVKRRAFWDSEADRLEDINPAAAKRLRGAPPPRLDPDVGASSGLEERLRDGQIPELTQRLLHSTKQSGGVEGDFKTHNMLDISVGSLLDSACSEDTDKRRRFMRLLGQICATPKRLGLLHKEFNDLGCWMETCGENGMRALAAHIGKCGVCLPPCSKKVKDKFQAHLDFLSGTLRARVYVEFGAMLQDLNKGDEQRCVSAFAGPGERTHAFKATSFLNDFWARLGRHEHASPGFRMGKQLIEWGR